MKFHLVDRIESLEPGQRIVTTKALSLAEEYLADHFPAFPVLPGVLMLEALVEAGAWLVRQQQGFAKSMVVLHRVRNVRYASFVQPGETLRCQVQAKSIDADGAKLVGTGSVGDRQTVSGKLELRCYNLADRQGHLAGTDTELIQQLQQRYKLIHGPEAMEAAGV